MKQIWSIFIVIITVIEIVLGRSINIRDEVSVEDECIFVSEAYTKGKKAYDCCSEEGVTCTDGHITKLEFTSKSITLKSSIENLRYLEQLYIIKTTANTIPSEIKNLTNLKELRIEKSTITGNIPSEIGDLTNLEQLTISSNKKMSGSIPSSIGNLKNLQKLDLSGNNLSGEIPSEIGNLTNLKTLDLSSNPDLTGTIPDALKSQLQEFKDQNETSGSAAHLTMNYLFYCVLTVLIIFTNL